jgi:hypothetical protein
MDQLWDSLTRDGDEIPSPDWHQDVLAERKARAQRGGASFSLWTNADPFYKALNHDRVRCVQRRLVRLANPWVPIANASQSATVCAKQLESNLKPQRVRALHTRIRLPSLYFLS